MSVRIDWKQAQLDFCSAYLNNTTKLTGQKRDWQQKTSLLLEFNIRGHRHHKQDILATGCSSPRIVKLKKIEAYQFGQGHGGEALEWLKNEAAYRGLALAAQVYPHPHHKNDPLNNFENLKAWYYRKGFIYQPLAGMHGHLIFNY